MAHTLPICLLQAICRLGRACSEVRGTKKSFWVPTHLAFFAAYLARWTNRKIRFMYGLLIYSITCCSEVRLLGPNTRGKQYISSLHRMFQFIRISSTPLMSHLARSLQKNTSQHIYINYWFCMCIEDKTKKHVYDKQRQVKNVDFDKFAASMTKPRGVTRIAWLRGMRSSAEPHTVTFDMWVGISPQPDAKMCGPKACIEKSSENFRHLEYCVFTK